MLKKCIFAAQKHLEMKMHNLLSKSLVGFLVLAVGCGTQPEACFEVEQDGAKLTSEADAVLNKEITFNNCSIDGEEFNWDFGDGTVSTKENPTHTYTAGGVYTVSLDVKNGSKEDWRDQMITIACQEGYEGDNCNEEKTPYTVTISKVRVLKFPAKDKYGSYWDGSSSNGPDLLIKIYQGSSSYYDGGYDVEYNAVVGQTYDFTPSFSGYGSSSYSYSIRLYDEDSYDYLMGTSSTFSLYTNGEGFPSSKTVSSTDGEYQFEVYFTYDWN